MAKVRSARAETRRAIVEAARPSARIAATQRSSSSSVASPTAPSRKDVQRREIAPIGVDGPRRPAGLEGEQEALDVGVGATHGARPDSAGRRSLLRVTVALAAVMAAFAGAPGVASASQLIARNTSTERIAVSSSGTALLTYHGRGRLQRVLVWGALNASAPDASRAQAEFRVDYSGRLGHAGQGCLEGRFADACGPYRSARSCAWCLARPRALAVTHGSGHHPAVY